MRPSSECFILIADQLGLEQGLRKRWERPRLGGAGCDLVGWAHVADARLAVRPHALHRHLVLVLQLVCAAAHSGAALREDARTYGPASSAFLTSLPP